MRSSASCHQLSAGGQCGFVCPCPPLGPSFALRPLYLPEEAGAQGRAPLGVFRDLAEMARQHAS